MRLIIHATNISQGGGRTLLTTILGSLPSDLEVTAQLDSRMPLPVNVSSSLKIRLVNPSIRERLLAEWWLKKNVKNDDLVICFGSLPPLIKLKSRVVVFMQNRYLIEKNSLVDLPFKTRLRLRFERIWLAMTESNADEFIVQSPVMKRVLLSSGFVKKRPIHIRPFVEVSDSYQRAFNHHRTARALNEYDFIYVASGEPHKNHRQLVEAWCLLAQQAIFPSLCLTINQSVWLELCAWIDKKKRSHCLNLINVGTLPHNQILELYSQSRALIFPSRFESFGLPLIEACPANLPVLAAELDYVRDVLDPVETFDPSSSVSIARAVKRYLGKEEAPLPLLDGKNFLHLLLK